MAKLTKEELIKKVSEKIEDTDLQLELMEDITDSFMDGEVVDKAELDKVSKELAELKEKYVEEAKEEVTDSEDELKEEEVIDIQEI